MDGRRRAFGLAMSAFAVGTCLMTCSMTGALQADERVHAGIQAAAHGQVTVTVVDRTLAATEAIADFGVTEGVRLVKVRIVDGLRLRVHIESAAAIELAEPPRVCLSWEFGAPDDAGLSERCWGEPELGPLVAAQLERTAAGQLAIGAGRPVEIVADLQRGDVRCDYPPANWQLEMALTPRIDGVAVDPIDLPPVAFKVPATGDGPLRFLRIGTRFCGLATIIVRDQGEPQVATP
jgi:hypothetical protein